MNITLVPILALSLIVSAGCVVSLQPLYTDKVLTYDPGLEGTWSGEKNSETWVFQKAEAGSYRLVYTEKGTAATFTVHLVRLGEHRFLDITPQDPPSQNEFYNLHLIPGHTFVRMKLGGDDLELALLSYDWFKRKLDDKKITVAHLRLDDRIILTAPPPALQSLMRRCAGEASAFGDPAKLQRVKPK